MIMLFQSNIDWGDDVVGGDTEFELLVEELFCGLNNFVKICPIYILVPM